MDLLHIERPTPKTCACNEKFVRTYSIMKFILLAGLALALSGCATSFQGADVTDKAYKDLKRGNYPRAEGILNETLASDPENVQALFYLGVVYQNTSRAKEASDAYLNAILLDPEETVPLRHRIGFEGETVVSAAKAKFLEIQGIEFKDKFLTPEGIQELQALTADSRSGGSEGGGFRRSL
ncbi:MAG: tetratricopeptide repeat protein [Desulfobacterales bacterium]|nr:tetratricopeptide repeat protein [Desulfobacterales bacterium]